MPHLERDLKIARITLSSSSHSDVPPTPWGWGWRDAWKSRNLNVLFWKSQEVACPVPPYHIQWPQLTLQHPDSVCTASLRPPAKPQEP